MRSRIRQANKGPPGGFLRVSLGFALIIGVVGIMLIWSHTLNHPRISTSRRQTLKKTIPTPVLNLTDVPDQARNINTDTHTRLSESSAGRVPVPQSGVVYTTSKRGEKTDQQREERGDGINTESHEATSSVHDHQDATKLQENVTQYDETNRHGDACVIPDVHMEPEWQTYFERVRTSEIDMTCKSVPTLAEVVYDRCVCVCVCMCRSGV
jgi:hypothetical protein